MTSPELWSRAQALYPALAGLPPILGLPHIRVPAATTLFTEGAPCQGFPMVLQGEIRVARGSPGGRQLELYRVTPGDLCVVSTSCLFGTQPLSAQGMTTQDSELLLLTPSQFESCCSDDRFRRFVFSVFADRLADLMALAEAVAFQRLDQRLAHALLGHGRRIHATHQQLADELGTVREIVTRLLRRFERAGLVSCTREQIDVLDAVALRQMASGASEPGAAGPAGPPHSAPRP